MEIVIGLVAGIILLIMATVWFTQKQQVRIEEEIQEAAEQNDIRGLALPLEKKLRDALYDCKRNISLCDKQIAAICKDQLDLVKDIGKKSHIEVKNKPLFFEYHNPVTGDRHFYYERDLNKQIDPQLLEDTQKTTKKYAQHIELLLTQKELFEKLIESHQENLDRVNGVKNQNSQAQKIKIHEEKIASLRSENKVEEEAIYGKLLIEGINEELDHQEECLRQYIELNKKYDHSFDEDVEQKFKIQLEAIIQQLEIEDPDHPQ